MSTDDTRPGDAISRDEEGHIRVSRTIPLPWLVGGLIAVAGQAIGLYYGQQQTAAAVKDIQVELRSINAALAGSSGKTIEHNLRLLELERRVGVLESVGRPTR